jgi:DNA-binding transcriptional LysR family regulator
LADCDSISQGQLREEQIILCDPANLPPAMVDLQLKLAEGRTPSTVQFSPSPDASLTLVRAGLGVAVLPDILVEEQDALTAVPLLDAPALSFGLYYKSHPGDGILKRFAQIARENMTEK